MKIVIVEDNETLRLSIESVLKHEGHLVKGFGNGHDARQFLLVEHVSVDVAIIDYLLPELDGVSLIHTLRTEGVTFPILMLTAKGEISDKVRGLQSGADYYLTKPFALEELLACIDALYRRPSNYQGECAKINEAVTYRHDTHELTKMGERVSLTHAEAGILEYLIRHSNQPCSQQTIYDAVFDFAKENWSNTVEVHIKNLRKKLAHPDYEDPIKTIRGVGYTLTC